MSSVRWGICDIWLKSPEEASNIFDRAEAGLDVLTHRMSSLATLYEVALVGKVAGVPLQGNPNDVYAEL